MHLIHFSGDAGADLDVRDPWRLVVESAAVLLRPGGGRRAGQAQEKVRQGRERERERERETDVAVGERCKSYQIMHFVDSWGAFMSIYEVRNIIPSATLSLALQNLHSNNEVSFAYYD